MKYYSQRHWRDVTPAADPREQVRARIARIQASALAHQDRVATFPHVTPDNVAEVLAFQEGRLAHHLAAMEVR